MRGQDDDIAMRHLQYEASTSPGVHPARGQAARSQSERGSALVIALLIMVIMTLLGLAFVLAGQTESRIAVNQRNNQQALQIAESGVRMAKKWFDAPSGTSSYLVPTTSQMDRTQRYVDDNADGTYTAYASATAPFNVTYRSSTNDPFEKPYRGSPALTLLGDEAHPDVVISESGSSAEQAFLTTVNSTLFTNFPTPGQQGRIAKIEVYSPPIISIAGVRTRYGIATIKVTAGIYEFIGTSDQRRISTRVAKAVINEAPYTGPSGPLQSGSNVDWNGNFTPHWGKVTAVRNMHLPNNPGKLQSSIPWLDRSNFVQRDINGDGTFTSGADDRDGDGTNDFDDWVALGSDLQDPWLRFWAEGTSDFASCTGLNCQPEDWFKSTRSPQFTGMSGNDNHTNIFHNVDTATFPEFNYQLWKNVAQSGTQNVYYYSSNGAGSGTYKLNGSGTSVSMRTATEDRTGLFFFDTSTNTVPIDADSNGSYDNLADDVSINGGGYASSGFIYMNADFRTTGNGSATNRTIFAPSEPYIDANSNGVYDPTEYFIDLSYPNSIGGNYGKSAMRREVDGFTRQVPYKDGAADGHYSVSLNLYGVLYTNGEYSAHGNWAYYGAVVTKEGMGNNAGGGTPDIYFDERLLTGAWPPADLGLPRTIITAWETDL